MNLCLTVLLGFFATQLIGCQPSCSIFGCQGNFEDPGTTDDKSTSSTTTTTTTTTTWKEPESLACTADNDAACADYLNAVYMSYDPENPTSALGVPMRGRPGFEMPWYFCTGQCHEGQPDCYVPGSLLNHRIMISKNNSVRLIMKDPVFIIFQPMTALEKLIKCAWQYDGAAFGRNNGGCGNGAPGGDDCDDPTSAYQDMCPDDPSRPADENCGNVITAWCGTQDQEYPATCYWKGPAWFSPVYPGAQPDLGRLNEVNEMKEMLKQRLKSQSFDAPPVPLDDDMTLKEYWNEITMDGRIIDQLLREDASQVVAAFGYVKGNGDARRGAEQYRDALIGQYGVKVPIISIDTTVDISKSGPFGIGEADLALGVLI